MKLVTAKPPLYPNITVDEIHSCLPHLYEPDTKDKRVEKVRWIHEHKSLG